jgi:hypothetical protein
LTQFPASIIYSIYYRKDDKIYRISEKGIWSEISLIQLETEIKKHTINDEKYTIIYHHIILNKLDYWFAKPDNINKDELEFWYSLGILPEEDYLILFNMMSSL